LGIGAVVVESAAMLPEPQNGVTAAADTKKSPEDNSGTPMDDEDSVIAVENSKPAAVPFGRAAYKKPDTTQVVAAVAVETQPEAEKEKKPKPEPRGVIKGWNQFITNGRSWIHATKREKDKAVFKWAEYAHWRGHEDGGAEGHYCLLKYGMLQSRYNNHSAYVDAFPDPTRDLKAARKLLEKEAYEQIRAWGYPKHR
jgi:hypothetical protein